MRVTLCGVRGSTPAPGPDFVRYGGHTSCVALSHDGEPPSLLLDGGTGIREVTGLLQQQPFSGSVLLGHLHWDHVQGLPFFRAGGLPGARVRVLLPAPDGNAVATLSRGMSPPHFPVGPCDLGAGWSFGALSEGQMVVEGFTVLVREIPHKGGLTYGFRVSDGTGSVAYLSDHLPLALGPGPDGQGALHEAALDLAHDVDLLLHDAQFLASEFPAVERLGHASVDYAVGLARAAGARRLGLYHHAPDRTDDEIDRIVRTWADSDVDVFAAAQGQALELTPLRTSLP